MNPEFIKAELEKTRAQGFTEELIVSKHEDGRVAILTHLPGSIENDTVVDACNNGINLVVSIILSMSKLYAAPGQDRALLGVFMKHLVERVSKSRALNFQMGLRPSVEPGLKMRTTDQEQPESDER